MKERGECWEKKTKPQDRRDKCSRLMNRMLIKTTEYLDHFARFKRKENVEAVERLLSAHKELAKFERAQLGTYILPSY
jgi:DNA-directed RNA polymerase II subunit RPB4